MPYDETEVQLLTWEKTVEKPMMFLSLLFLIIVIIPSAHPLTHQERQLLDHIDQVIWVLFALDYFGKFAIAKHKKLFFKTHLFELAIVALPFLRPLRLLRLIPLMGYFLRYARRSLSGRLVQYVTLAATTLTTIAAVLMYEVERTKPGATIKSLGDSLWWAISTITTVGYGDRYPVTAIGRVIAVVVMLSGISLIGIITASIAAWIVKSDEDAADQVQMAQLLGELQEIKRKLDERDSGSQI